MNPRNLFFLLFAFGTFFLNPTLSWSQGQEQKSVETPTQKDPVTNAVFDVKNLPASFQESDNTLNKAQGFFNNNQFISELKKDVESHEEKISSFSSDTSSSILFTQNFNELENKKVHWSQFKIDNQKITEKINNEIVDLQEEIEKCNFQVIKWKNTLALLDTVTYSETTFERIASLQEKAKGIQKTLEDSLTSLFKIGDRINESALFISEVANDIANVIKERQKDVFALNSLPIWDEITHFSEYNLKEQFNHKRKSIKEDISVFVDSNKPYIYFHFFLFILTFFSVFYLRYWFLKKAPEKIQEHTISLIVLEHPGWSSFLIGLLIFFVLYPTRPTTLLDLMVFTASIPVLVLLPKFIQNKFNLYLYGAIVLMVFDLLHSSILPDDFWIRIDYLIEAILASVILGLALRKNSPFKVKSDNLYFGIVKFLLPFLLILVVISFFSNLFGAVTLARITVKSVVRLVSGSVIVFLIAKVLESIFLLFLDSKIHKNSVFLSRYQEKSKLYIFSALRLWLIFIVLSGFAKNLLIYDWISNAYDELMAVGYTFGEVTLNIGDLVNFILIVLIFSLLGRFFQVLVAEEILGKLNIKKGLPLAIGIVTKYFILLLGFLMAVAAMGIDLDKLSFILGALGVGIGFGLQSVIGNFISGLILIFERPIHIGDVIIVENLEGTVTEIGIRSSKVKTWDGAEVVVPNMNFISNSVTNWTLSDQLRRRTVLFYASPEASPHEVITLIKDSIAEKENIKKDPEPMVLYQGYKDFYNVFKALYWIEEDMLITDSDVSSAVYDKLKAKSYHVNPQHPVFYKPGNENA